MYIKRTLPSQCLLFLSMKLKLIENRISAMDRATFSNVKQKQYFPGIFFPFLYNDAFLTLWNALSIYAVFIFTAFSPRGKPHYGDLSQDAKLRTTDFSVISLNFFSNLMIYSRSTRPDIIKYSLQWWMVDR